MLDLKTQLMQTDPEYQDYPKKSVKLNEVYTPGLSTLSEESSNKNSKGDIGSAQKSPCTTSKSICTLIFIRIVQQILLPHQYFRSHNI